MLTDTKSFNSRTLFNMSLSFAVHYMCVLAPEAVTDLDYEQGYGGDNLIKITINWIVSSQSESKSCKRCINLELSSVSPFINTTSCTWIQCFAQWEWNGADVWDHWHKLCHGKCIPKFVCLCSCCCQHLGCRGRKWYY